MKLPRLLFGLLLCFFACQTKQEPVAQRLISADIDRFWAAYDQIQAEPDTARHLQLLQEGFIEPASEGQRQLFAIRNYTPEEYLANIRAYPQFYASLRRRLDERAPIEADIRAALGEFQTLYPQMQTGKVYLGIGNFRTNGTTVDSMVLFGAEMAFTDTTVNTSEFPAQYQYFKNYIRDYDPINNVGQLFLSDLSMELFNRYPSWWVWSDTPNPFGQRDLGYYVGYALSEHYYQQAPDKQAAIAHLIELDYGDADSVRAFVDKMGFFEAPLADLEAAYREAQPMVTRVEQEAGRFTVHFSEPMDTLYRGFDYGPMGEEHVLRINQYLGFSASGRSVSFRAVLTPGKAQQLTLSRDFRNRQGVELVPYVLTIEE